MIYQNIREAVFLSRPNRFVAEILLDDKIQLCHVKNTGRCRELLIPGVRLFVQEFHLPARKTNFDLIAVYKGSRLINMDSQAPNHIFAEWVKTGGLFSNIAHIKSEVTYGESRFDFYLEADGKQIFAEIKGVTLEEDGIARFPDAPTLRGIKHLNGLGDAVAAGYDAYAVFIIQMKGIRQFTPNLQNGHAFAEALQRARDRGVHLVAVDCAVTPDSIFAREFVPIYLPTLSHNNHEVTK